MTYCHLCHKALGPLRAGAFCEPCITGIAEDMGRLQNLPPGEIVLLSDIFTTCGAFFLARAMVGALPFEVADE